ncbi:MobP2 family relaxase [Carnobacterium maltaromaticum]|uniref:MobP2 family relaxase n=1 Tax=Carnobacterium maltaromaticum TaxID=2751 RepID=UPI001DD9824C|nr:MobP2 family relaxase [Carnobacterium maltaromaticum]MCC4313477.1 hypothetical protein [Carnobacterium maltaromaticum]
MIKAGIVHVSKYTSSSGKKFSSYVDYVDRDEAVRTKNFNKFNMIDKDGYNNYMENPEKSTGLFTQNKDSLNKNERRELKKQFQKAQKNESIMWQDVLSFDNRWLEKNGIYKSKEGWLNEELIKRAVREGMSGILENENMKHSAVWSAAVHYNTDNIHVHIAIVEPNPTREKKTFINKKTKEPYVARVGHRKYDSLKKFKSKLMGVLVDRSEHLTRLSALIHKKMGVKQQDYRELPNKELHSLYNRIYDDLPDDKRKWKYNMNALSEVKPYINKFVAVYVNEFLKDEFNEFKEMVNSDVDFYQEAYGAGSKESAEAEKRRTNKYDELFAKIGNSLLGEMRLQSEVESRRGDEKVNGSQINNPEYNKQSHGKKADLNKLKKAFKKDFESIKNQQVYLKNLKEQQGMDRL